MNIEFRAHIKETGAILHVVVIDWVSKEVRCVIGGKYEDPTDGMVREDWDFPVFSFDEVDLEQFTGKLDRNGKKIFAGATMSNGTGRTCEVIWFEPTGQWDLRPLDMVGTCKWGSFEDWGKCEIIGTIHD